MHDAVPLWVAIVMIIVAAAPVGFIAVVRPGQPLDPTSQNGGINAQARAPHHG